MATAALLAHVARIDGVVSERERDRLVKLLADRFGLSRTAAEALAGRGDRLDGEVDDVADLVERFGHGDGPVEGRGLIGMAYAVAAADGDPSEFEDDLIWRLAHRLGLSDTEIDRLRQEAVGGGASSP